MVVKTEVCCFIYSYLHIMHDFLRLLNILRGHDFSQKRALHLAVLTPSWIPPWSVCGQDMSFVVIPTRNLPCPLGILETNAHTPKSPCFFLFFYPSYCNSQLSQISSFFCSPSLLWCFKHVLHPLFFRLYVSPCAQKIKKPRRNSTRLFFDKKMNKMHCSIQQERVFIIQIGPE